MAQGYYSLPCVRISGGTSDFALGIGLVVAAGVLLATGLVGFCGLYSLLGIRTSQPREQL